MNWLDRAIAWMSPSWGQSRARARMMVRHFDSASVGRRTEGWHRRSSDANAAAPSKTLVYLRGQARDLVRNNPWARRGLKRIVTNTVGWGIKPKATGRSAEQVMELWRRWGETTECDATGRMNFYGLQKLVMRTIVESGEVIIRRRRRRPEDELSVPLQLQVLEPDHIDSDKEGRGSEGGQIINGIEFDAIGRRVAYWLFAEHPGSTQGAIASVSTRVPAESILHVFDQERPGQARGIPWFASVDVRLHDFAEFEDATLVKQKIAACMAAFVTDPTGENLNLAKDGSIDAGSGANVDVFEPGAILTLPPGKTVTVANPPQATDHQSFSTTALRGIAAGLDVTFEDLTGDYSNVNFSSARMGRLGHAASVHDWRWNMLIPQFCDPVWEWMLEAAIADAGVSVDTGPAKWTPPPAQMLDPEKEGAAAKNALRAGLTTFHQLALEQGYDPEEHYAEFAAGLKLLDKHSIVLDSDPRKTNGSGQLQSSPSTSAEKPTSNGVPKNGVKAAAPAANDTAS